MEMKTYADTGLVSQIARSLWPVGAIYSSTVNVSPADLFGFGVWEPIRGVFLLAENDEHPAGSTGGEFEHTLTVAEMPSHTHNIKAASDMIQAGTGRSQINTGGTEWGGVVTYAGGSQPHNNTPPHLSVYMWKRVS